MKIIIQVLKVFFIVFFIGNAFFLFVANGSGHDISKSTNTTLILRSAISLFLAIVLGYFGKRIKNKE